MSNENVQSTFSAIDNASRITAGMLISNLERTKLTTAEQDAALMIINRLPGMSFQVDFARNGQDVAGLLRALEECGKNLGDLYVRINGLEEIAQQTRADQAAVKRLLGL